MVQSHGSLKEATLKEDTFLGKNVAKGIDLSQWARLSSALK